MTAQTQIQFGKQLAREGAERAERHANAVHDSWSEKALEFFKGYAESNPKFMVEDVRFASQGLVPVAPSQRSWGAIVLKAAKAGWIHNDNREFSQVKNGKAHRANAAVWKSLICKR